MKRSFKSFRELEEYNSKRSIVFQKVKEQLSNSNKSIWAQSILQAIEKWENHSYKIVFEILDSAKDNPKMVEDALGPDLLKEIKALA